MYDYTIFPLELLLKSLLFVLNDLTHNYVFALMLLSVLVRCMTTPLEKFANTIVANEQALQDIISPQLATIKETYSGSEKHSAIQRLYARYSYHPIFAIRGTVGLLVQLPFFFAAFMMIGNLPELKGYVVPFLGDLGKPDGLLAGINLLPFVMTAINIVAVYTLPNQTSKGRRQAVILALLFLVLLYAEPAALVVYWTTNNVLSLAKNFWNKLDRYSLSIDRNRLPNFLFHQGIGWGLSVVEIVFFAVALTSLLKAHFPPGPEVFRATIFMMLPVFGNYLYLLTCSRQSIFSAFGMVLIAALPFVYFLKISTSVLYLSAVIIALGYVVFSVRRFGVSRHTIISLLIGCYISLISIVVNPLNIFNSDPVQFGGVGFNIVLFGAVIWCVATFLFFTIARLHDLFAGCMFSCAIFLTCYTYWVPLKLGVFRGIYFTNDELLTQGALGQGLMEVMLVVVLVSAGAFYYRRYENKLLPIMVVCLLAVSMDAGMLFCKAHNVQVPSSAPLLPLKDITSPIRFSKEGKNIVFIVPDAAKGSVFANVFKEYPDLLRSFSGFTFFPNTVASGPSTITNTAAVVGGEQFTLPCLQNDKNRTIREKIRDAYQLRQAALEKNGYDSMFFNLNYLHKESWANNSPLIFHQNNFLPYLKKKFKFQVPTVVFEHKMVALLAGFRMSPLFVKRILYSSELWQKTLKSSRNHGYVRSAEDELFMRALPLLSVVEHSNNAHFTQIWSHITHFPFAYDRNRNVIDINKGSSISGSYESAVLFLRDMEKWIAWMKENGVYDNTKIIFVSDHGSGVHETWNIGASNAVLMVKDFFAPDSSMKTNDLLMSNSDAAYFVTSDFSQRAFSKPEGFQREDRVLKYYITGDWVRNQLETPLFDLLKRYEITGDVTEISKWKRIDE